MNLKGRVALVTGGSRGIGRSISLALASAGASVVLTYKDNLQAAEEVIRSIEKNNGNASAIQLEVKCRNSIRAVVKYIEQNQTGLDILVNNAGINNPNDFDLIDEEEWDNILAVNLKGPFLCIQEALPLLKKSKYGSIINISSVSGQYGGPRTAHYAASKAGLISLSQVAARFVSQYGIRCNTVAAGLISSDMAVAGMQSTAVQKASESILLRRLGFPEEVANTVVFLASDDSSYITGQSVNVNGGLYF